MSKYDEDITKNPFFQSLLTFLTSFEDVVLLLVPRKDSLPRVKLDDPSDLKCHVVVEKNEKWQTLNEENVVINDSYVQIGQSTVGQNS